MLMGADAAERALANVSGTRLTDAQIVCSELSVGTRANACQVLEYTGALGVDMVTIVRAHSTPVKGIVLDVLHRSNRLAGSTQQSDTSQTRFPYRVEVYAQTASPNGIENSIR